MSDAMPADRDPMIDRILEAPTVTAALVAFLRARLDDDEQAARVSIEQTAVNLAGGEADAISRWRVVERPATGTFVTARDQWDRVTEVVPTYGGAHSEHIARHDPARVLAEVEAKRRVAKVHFRRRSHDWDEPGVVGFECAQCCDRYPCQTLRLLAAVWREHPEHDPAWAPDA